MKNGMNMAEHQRVLKKLAELIREQKDCGGVIDAANRDWGRDLDEQIRKTGERFTVQIVGVFNSGKSTMINAMLGEELLPTGDLPETGVLSELVYGAEKSVTLYPRKGRWETDGPVSIPATMEAISQHCSIDNEGMLNGEEDHATCCFEKMVVTWPMELLRDGVVLVDSVGLDDPWGNDDITRGYLPRADAVIYLLNCAVPFSATDQKALGDINQFGIRNIIFGATHFGELTMRNRRAPDKLTGFMEAIRQHCAKHTDLGEGAVHFLDSLDALDGKLSSDREQLVRSGFPEFEAYLSSYLVEDKGRDQVRNIERVMRGKAEQMRSSALSQNQTGKMDKEKFDLLIDEQKERLTLARLQMESASRGFRSKMEATYDRLDALVDDFIAQLPGQLDLEDFTPQTQFPVGAAALNPVRSRKISKAFAQEAQNELKKQTDKLTGEWVRGTVIPFLQSEVEKASESVQPELDSFCSLIQSIDRDLTGRSSTNASISQIALAFAGNGIFSALVVAIYGKEAAGRVLTANALVLCGAFVLGMLSAPLTVPAVVLATIATNLIAITSGTSEKKVAQAKKSALKDYRKQLATYMVNRDPKKGESPADTMKKSMHGLAGSICDEMDKLLQQDLDNIETQINTAIDNYHLSQDRRNEEMTKRTAAVERLDVILEQVREIAQNYDIGLSEDGTK